MTGPWEERLRNIAEGGSPWDVPTREELLGRLRQLKYVLDKVASEPGLAGQSGQAATESFAAVSTDISKQISYLETDLPTAIDDANAERTRARELADQLSSGGLNPGQEALVRGAAVGTTLVLGPLSLVAGEGAVQAFNHFLGQQREEDAKRAVEKVSNNLDSLDVPPAPPVTVLPPAGTKFNDGPTPDSTDYDFGGPSGPGSFSQYPDFDVAVGTHVGQVPGTHPTPIPGPVTGPGLTPVGPGPVIGPGPGDVIDLGPVPPDYTPTPDGPTGGISTLPGGATLPGVGGGSGGTTGIGSGLGVGLAAGGAGALALGRAGGATIGAGGGTVGGGRVGPPVVRGGGLSGGLLGNAGGGAGGAASGLGSRGAAATAGGARGLGGGAAGGGAAGGGTRAGATGGTRGVGGAGGGVRGAGGAAGAGRGGVAGAGTRGTGAAGGRGVSSVGGAAGTGARGSGAAGSTPRGVGGAGGGAVGASARGGASGIGGSTGAGARGGATGASGGGTGSGIRGGVAGGGPANRADSKGQQGRGLGGPIAERIEDDEDFGPLSENAGAGGRDES